MRMARELKERSPLAPEVHLTFANVALGGGYGYNFVFGKHSQWLFHLSALPSVVLYKHNRLTVNGNEMKDHRLCFNMIFNERAALVYHFTPRYNIGASLIMSNSLYDNGDIKFNQNKYLARAFVGAVMQDAVHSGKVSAIQRDLARPLKRISGKTWWQNMN